MLAKKELFFTSKSSLIKIKLHLSYVGALHTILNLSNVFVSLDPTYVFVFGFRSFKNVLNTFVSNGDLCVHDVLETFLRNFSPNFGTI